MHLSWRWVSVSPSHQDGLWKLDRAATRAFSTMVLTPTHQVGLGLREELFGIREGRGTPAGTASVTSVTEPAGA